MPALPDDQFPTGDPLLASFVDDLRVVAGGPAPDPRPGLLAVMGQGTTVPTAPTSGRERNMPFKTVFGGLAARLALGVGVATATMTAAGAAGVLPEPAQQAVAAVVGAATPFELPDPSSVGLLAGDEGSTTTSTTATTLAGDDELAGEEAGERKANHGACVSAVAQDRSASASEPHGKTVSSVARSDCGKASASTSTTVGGSPTSSSTTSTTVDDGERSANSNRGRGNGNANGGSGNSGNSGSGNSGKN